MNIREQWEAYEIENLSPFACKSAYSKGRKKPADRCDIRTDFQKDRDRITHCKAFRRLMHKTQVFISPEGDHYRTRLTHTLEVAQIARTAARALRLNEDLTEAIALGHDLGHTPFGHTGEDALNHLSPDGFKHNEQSVRVVEWLENDGEGLNLTAEVIDGLYHHRSTGKPMTAEGRVVQISDKIAYMNHDIDDAIRSGLLDERELPIYVTETLGASSGMRIDFLIRNLIENSRDTDEVKLEPSVHQTMMELRAFLFKNVYACQLQQNERKKIQSMLGLLFSYYMDHMEELPPEFRLRLPEGESHERAVCDYIACMTDRYAYKRYKELFIPAVWGS